jgi:hypothetical protein
MFVINRPQMDKILKKRKRKNVDARQRLVQLMKDQQEEGETGLIVAKLRSCAQNSSVRNLNPM